MAFCSIVFASWYIPASWLVLDGTDNDHAPAQRFNRTVLDYARSGRAYNSLASPLLRSGISLNELGMLALAAVYDGKGDDAGTAQHAMSILKTLGKRPTKDGVAIENDTDAVAALVSVFRPILEEDLLVFRRLGVL